MTEPRPRVLLIEDDELVVGIVEQAVEAEQWSLRSAGLLAQASREIAQFKPDAVLLDLSLPDGDGISFCRALRRSPATERLPVIMLTSRGEIQTRLQGFAAGAQDYITKPFEPAELLARLGAHLAIKENRDRLEAELVEKAVRERVRQDLSDMVAHDLRTPLAAIKVTLELVRRQKLISETQCQRFMESAELSVDIALLMVNDLLDLGAGKLAVNPAPMDIGRLAGRLASVLALQYAKRGVALVFDTPAAAIVSDETVLFRVLMNLLGNSLKFSPEGGRVVCRGVPRAGGLRLEIIDGGPGVPDAEKEAIFDKFFRGAAAATWSVPGAGVGLSFCRMAAQALGGKIWVEDGSGGGSVFVLELPSR